MTRSVSLVMLPGAQCSPADFAAHGFIEALDGLDVAVVAADLPSETYLDGDVAPALHARVIEPLLSRGPTRLWMLGISLGGMGALLSARAALAPIEGLILLSPFLGTRGIVASVSAQGGLSGWQPPVAGPDDIEIGLLTWLKSRPFAERDAPAVHLGCGLEDRYAPASRLLADMLPPDCVHFERGGHDWPSWRSLWITILDTGPFKNI